MKPTALILGGLVLVALAGVGIAVASRFHAPADPASQTPPPAEPASNEPPRSMTVKELGNFEYDPVKGGLPDSALALEGKRVRLRGAVLPLSQAAQLTDFALVADRFSCCFGNTPLVQHIVTVKLPKDKAIDYTDSDVWIEGTLRIKEDRPDGDFTVNLFTLHGTSVKLAQ